MKNMKILSISIIFVALIISATLIVINIDKFEGEKNTIQTSGSSTIQAKANKVSLYVSYEARADTAEEAQQNNSEVSNAVIQALKDAGMREEDIETTYYYVSPEYQWTSEGRVFKGYLATHTIKATSEELDKIGSYIDAAIRAGANIINNLNYELTEEEQDKLKAEALKKATQNARIKAEAIAEGSGTRIVKVKSISDTYSYNPWRYDIAWDTEIASSEREISLPTQVETGSVTIHANINAVFEIA